MTTLRECRIEPIPASEWTTEVVDALAAFPAGLDFILQARKAGDPCPRGEHVLGALARHPALARAFLAFNAHIAVGSSLTARTRELVILRISWLLHSEYEFTQHVILGRRAGLSDQELAWLQASPQPGCWGDLDECALLAVDELHASARVSGATWTRLSAHFDHRQLLDLLFIAGCYTTLALVLNSIELPLEPGTPSLPADVRANLLGDHRA